MVKIHIIGGSGSGKTILAQQLSLMFHAPHYDLDQVSQKHGNQMTAYIDDAFAIARQPEWITEGIYIIWTDPLLDQADCIVLLDVSWPIAAWRIIWRHINGSLHRTNPYPGLNGVKLLLRLLKFTRLYYIDKVSSNASTVEAVHKCLEEQRENAESINGEILLMRLETSRATIPLTADFVRMYLEGYKERVFAVKDNADRERLFELLAKR